MWAFDQVASVASYLRHTSPAKVALRGGALKLRSQWSCHRWTLSKSLQLLGILCCVLSLAQSAPASAQQQQIGPVTGLPMPRYVSLKSDRVNLREGPSKEHRTAWVFQRAGLPVEVTAEFANWRKIRDSEGSEGWVLQSLLSGRRTALVAPWKKTDSFPIYAQNSEASAVVAQLQSGVIGNIRKCDGTWCRIFGDGYDGFIQQGKLWGVYENDTVP